MGMSTLQLDVTDQASVDACQKATARLTGDRLDILVNNAGVTMPCAALDLDLNSPLPEFEVNVIGTMRMCKAFADLIIAARGLIVNEASIAAFWILTVHFVYVSSKAAQMAYSRTLAIEMRPLGVRVMSAVIGFVKSNVLHNKYALVDLPPSSHYRPAASYIHELQDYPRSVSPMDTALFASRLVRAALRDPGWLDGLLGGLLGGSSEHIWEGNSAMAARLASFLPYRLFDALLGMFLRIDRLYSQMSHKNKTA